MFINSEKYGAHIMEFFSAIRKNEVMLFAGKWIHMEMIISSGLSQYQTYKFLSGDQVCIDDLLVLLILLR